MAVPCILPWCPRRRRRGDGGGGSSDPFERTCPSLSLPPPCCSPYPSLPAFTPLTLCTTPPCPPPPPLRSTPLLRLQRRQLQCGVGPADGVGAVLHARGDLGPRATTTACGAVPPPQRAADHPARTVRAPLHLHPCTSAACCVATAPARLRPLRCARSPFHPRIVSFVRRPSPGVHVCPHWNTCMTACCVRVACVLYASCFACAASAGGLTGDTRGRAARLPQLPPPVLPSHQPTMPHAAMQAHRQT
jgi:hypothetical protein